MPAKHAAQSTPERHGDMSHADHREMIRRMRAPWLWTNFTVIALGLLTPVIVVHSVRMLISKAPPQDDDLPET